MKLLILILTNVVHCKNEFGSVAAVQVTRVKSHFLVARQQASADQSLVAISALAFHSWHNFHKNKYLGHTKGLTRSRYSSLVCISCACSCSLVE